MRFAGVSFTGDLSQVVDGSIGVASGSPDSENAIRSDEGEGSGRATPPPTRPAQVTVGEVDQSGEGVDARILERSPGLGARHQQEVTTRTERAVQMNGARAGVQLDVRYAFARLGPASGAVGSDERARRIANRDLRQPTGRTCFGPWAGR